MGHKPRETRDKRKIVSMFDLKGQRKGGRQSSRHQPRQSLRACLSAYAEKTNNRPKLHITTTTTTGCRSDDDFPTFDHSNMLPVRQPKTTYSRSIYETDT